MTVGVLHLDLHLPGGQSLKEKRSVLKRLTDQLRNRFNISVAEVDDQDLWQRAGVGIAAVGSDRQYVDGQLATVVDWVRESRLVDIIDYEVELL